MGNKTYFQGKVVFLPYKDVRMGDKEIVRSFDDHKIRSVWDETAEKWYFSVVDVVWVLTEQPSYQRARNYWKVLKSRLLKEGNETVTNCNRLKLLAEDGKFRLTDVVDTEQLFRLVQSIPSRKAEPFKQWIAKVAKERIDEIQDPELTIDRALWEYRQLGYSDNWINQRLKSIEVRKQLTDEWKRSGIQDSLLFASLTDIVTATWSGMTTKEYKYLKGLKKENLRDNMTNTELVLNMLAEAATTDLSKEKNPRGFDESAAVAKDGGSVAKAARLQLEEKLGHPVISSLNAKNLLQDAEEDTE